jgi:hypothetical protein
VIYKCFSYFWRLLCVRAYFILLQKQGNHAISLPIEFLRKETKWQLSCSEVNNQIQTYLSRLTGFYLKCNCSSFGLLFIFLYVHSHKISQHSTLALYFAGSSL